MKKLILIITTFITFNTNAGWIDDWAEQSTHSGPNYFESQQRGYFNGGSYSARFRNKKEYLFSIQKPRVSSGCGGIDLFMGGFSYMNMEYLGQKLQRALQAAPAVAFDLALKEACPECSATLAKLEGIINQLNSLQMDECGTSKEIATALVGKNGFEASGGIFSEISGLFDSKQALNDGTIKNRYHSNQEQVSNGNKPIVDQEKSIEGCSPEFKKIFTTDGSLLNNIAKTKGLEAYANYMRAYIGDVIIKHQDKVYAFTPVDSCSDMDVAKIDDIVLGDAKIRPVDGSACIKSNDVSLITSVEDKLTAIADKIKTKGQLSVDEKNFLNAIPYNIHSALAFAVHTGGETTYINNFKNTIARLMAYALVDDLVDNIRSIIKVASNNAKLASTGGNSTQSCEPLIVGGLIQQVGDFKKESITLQQAVRTARRENIKEVNNNIIFNQNLAKTNKNK
jgi:conjugative transfer pilus assembly protein TraH